MKTLLKTQILIGCIGISGTMMASEAHSLLRPQASIQGSDATQGVSQDLVPTTKMPTQVIVRTGQSRVQIHLPANATTGYQWFLESYSQRDLKYTGYEYEQDPAPKGMMGVPGVATFTFALQPHFQLGPQVTPVEFISRQPWQGGAMGTPVTVEIMVLPQG